MTNTDNKIEINELIKQRWSPRAFDSKPVEEEKLEALFEAARWAASAMNEQPWRFVFATKDNPEAYEKLLSTLVEANQVWAQEAPVLILSVAKTSYSNFDSHNPHAWHDTGLATANLALQATELGLNLHVMGGFSVGKAREVLGIPEGYEPVSVIALGYQGDADQLPEPLKERETAPRSRKPLQEIVFNGTWN
ncbi:nitroreductase family protein [Pontibacter populi]|uniref:Nitroreductase family protein n=1 Tax=Pontibacter populi TaxID=890055 RepID=A0ABV1RRL2_9BACT